MAGPGSASCLQHGWGQENPTQTAPGEALTTRHRTGVQFPPSPPHRASGQENPGLRTGVLFASAAFPCLMDFSLRGYAGSCPSRREKVHVRSPLRPHHVHNTDKARAHAFKFAPHRTGGPLRHFFLRVMPAGHEAEVRPPLLGPRSLLVAAHCADEVDPHRPLARAVGSGLDQPRGRVVQDLTQLRFAHPLREAMALCHLHGYIEGNCRITSANHQLQRYGRPPNQEPEQMAAAQDASAAPATAAQKPRTRLPAIFRAAGLLHYVLRGGTVPGPVCPGRQLPNSHCVPFPVAAARSWRRRPGMAAPRPSSSDRKRYAMAIG